MRSSKDLIEASLSEVLTNLEKLYERGELKLLIPAYLLPDRKDLRPLLDRIGSYEQWARPYTTRRGKGFIRRLLLGVLLANFTEIYLSTLMESLRGVSASMVPSDRALFSYLWILRKLELLRILDYGNKNIFNDLRFWLLMTTKDPRLYRRRKRRFLKHFAIRRRALIEDRCKKETIELIIRYSDKGNLRASAENEYVARLVIIFLRRALESTST